jgi:hypothetical protein
MAPPQPPTNVDISGLLAACWLAPAGGGGGGGGAAGVRVWNLDSGEALSVGGVRGGGQWVGPIAAQGRLRLQAHVQDPASYSWHDNHGQNRETAGGALEAAPSGRRTRLPVLRFARRFTAARTTVLLPPGWTLVRASAPVSPERLLDESPWLQFTSECQRFWAPTAPQ